MRILRHYRNPPAEAKGSVVALGNFDGVHRGHQALIAEAGRIAKQTGHPLAALVFEPYPREFFRPRDEPFRLTPFRAKARLLSELGVEYLIVLGFDAEMAGKLAQDFVIDVLVRELEASHVVVGEDFRFGKGRGGDVTVLGYMGEMEGFGVTVFRAVGEAGEKISSSKVRTALKAGRPEEAARLLGHWWSIEAHVASGDRRGRALGFPTANLKLEHTLQPAFGIYAVRARTHDGKAYDGVASFGMRPMFQLPAPLMEVHLFGFAGDIYGEVLAVELIAYLRGEQTFSDVDALKVQIAADCDAARRILAVTPPVPAVGN
ncbi:MAG TPA: bifunctional riboflavin kinase/FAD synthetase [Micropepsaceae bacterium]|nr:bifunctional riboflavin kinase/FAD synthetase [Micropepsaceae bacterium]